MASTKRVTTLELNITSKTAKTFFADLSRMAKDTRQDIADLQLELAQTKSELAGGKRTGESDTEWNNRASSLQATITKTQENIDKLNGQVRTWETMLKGQLTNINQLAKAMDDMSGRNLKELNAALNEYNKKLLNIGKANNFQRDQKFLMEYGNLVTAIRKRVTELKLGFTEMTEAAAIGLEHMGRPLHKIPGLVDAINKGLQNMSGNDTLDKLEQKMTDLSQGKFSGAGATLTGLYKTLEQHQQSFVEGTKDWNLVERAMMRIQVQYDEIINKQNELKNKRKELKAATKAGDQAEIQRLTSEVATLQGEIKSLNSAMSVRLTVDVDKIGKDVLKTIDSAREGYQRLKEDLDALSQGSNQVTRVTKQGTHVERLTGGDLVGDISKVLPYVKAGTQEYKDLYDAMKQVYMQDWNIDRMVAFRDALKENVKLFDEESDEFKGYSKMIAEFDARIIEAQNHWKDMQNASEESLKTMQRQYEQLIKDGQVEGESLQLIKDRLTEIKDLRRDKATNVLDDRNIKTMTPERIRESIDALKELRDAEQTTDSARKQFNEYIVRGEQELERQETLLKLVRLQYQLTHTTLKDLSDDALKEQVKAWRDEADAIMRAEGNTVHYRQAVTQLNKLLDEQHQRLQDNANGMLGTSGTNGSAQTVQQYQDGIKMAKDLIESGKLTTAEIGQWQSRIAEATAEMQKMQEQETRDVQLIRMMDTDVQNLSRTSLPQIIQQWDKLLEAEKAAGNNVQMYEQQLDDAKDRLKDLNEQWAEDVMSGPENFSTQEVQKAIQMTEERARKLQAAGDTTWKDFIKDAADAKKQLESFSREGKMELMRQQMTDMKYELSQMNPVSKEALKAQMTFWKGIRDNATSTAAQVQEAMNRIAEAETAQRDNTTNRAQNIMHDLRTPPQMIWNGGAPQIAPYWQNGGPGVDQMKEDIETLKEYREHVDKAMNPAAFRTASDAIADLTGKVKEMEHGLLSMEDLDGWIPDDIADQKEMVNQFADGSIAKLKQMYESAKLWKETLEAKAVNMNGQDLEDANQKIARYNDLMAMLKGRIDDAAMSEDRFNMLIKSIDTATPNDLKDLLKELEKRIGNLKRGTDEYTETAENIRKVKQQLEGVNQSLTEQVSGIEKVIKRLTTYVGVYMSFQKGLDIIKDLFRGSKELSDLTSDIQKRAFTGDQFDVARKNALEVGSALDILARSTRTSQEQLYKLGATAGLLGLKEKDDIIGFAEAADMLSVALVELGEDGATQLMKISTLTGEVQRQGPKDALISVGSSINALTAASAASAGPITEFISRVGAVGASAKMTIADIAGLGAALDALGQPMELSGTSVNRFIMALRNNTLGIAASLGINPEQIQKLVSTGRTMEALIVTLEEMKKKGGDMSAVFGELGSEGVRMKQTMESLMNNTEFLREQVRLSNDEYRKGTSVINEYNIKNSNTAAIMERVGNMWETAFTNSDAEDTWRGLSLLILGITKFLTAWPPLLKIIIGCITGMAAQMYLFKNSTNAAYAGVSRLKAGLLQCGHAIKTGLKGGLIGIATSFALTKILEFVSKWYDKMVALVKQTKDLQEVLETARGKATAMFNALRRMTEKGLQGTKEYKDMLSELNNEYGKYIGYTITETTSLNQLALAQESVNAALREQIRLEDQRGKIADIQATYADTESEAYATIETHLRRNYSVQKSGSGRESVPHIVEREGTSHGDAQVALFGVAFREAVATAIKDGFRVDTNNDDQSTKEADSKALAIFNQAVKDSGIFNYTEGKPDIKGQLSQEEYNERMPDMRNNFLKYLRAYSAELQKTNAIFDSTAEKIKLDAQATESAEIAHLNGIAEEYDEVKKVDVSKKSEEEQKKHYARLLELQQNYESKYMTISESLSAEEKKAASMRIEQMKKLEGQYRELAGELSQFGFENVEWAKMSGDELKRHSDELNKIWKFYSANGDWQAFGQRVRGEGFAEQKDAKAWIAQQVQAIADRADFLQITRPSGWKYPEKGSEKDPTQDLMNEYLKKLEDYYNQEKEAIRRYAIDNGEAWEITERKLYKKDEEYKAARVGLQMMYLQDLNTIDEKRRKQFRLLTQHEIEDIEQRRKDILAALEKGDVAGAIAQSDLFGIGSMLEVKEQQTFVSGARNEQLTDSLQKWAMDMFNADPTKVWDVAGLRAAAEKQGGDVAAFIAEMQDAEVKKLADALGRLTKAQTTTRTVGGGQNTKSQQEYIDRMMPILQKELERQGIDGTFIYSLLAQTGIESRWGLSGLSAKYNNFGGMTKGTTKLPNEQTVAIKDPKSGKMYNYVKFDSAEQYAQEYIAYLNRKGAFKGTARDFGTNVKKFGYAEDPNYASKVDEQARRLKGRMQDHTGGATAETVVNPVTSASGLGDVAEILTAYTEKVEETATVLNEEKTRILREALVTLYNNNVGEEWTAESLLGKAEEQGGLIAEQFKAMTQQQLDVIASYLGGLRGEIDTDALQAELEELNSYINTKVGYEAYNFGAGFQRNIGIIHKNLGKTDPKFENMRNKVRENTSGDMLEFSEGMFKEIKEAHKIMLESAPLLKVMDDFRANMTKLQLIFTDNELEQGIDKQAGVYERRIQMLQGYSARISTMTQEEFIGQISQTKDFSDRTIEQYLVMYDELLKLRDDYDEAARKQAKQSLKLLTNRVESGEYYAQQLASLRKYQEELVKAGKTSTEAYAAVARAIDVVAQKQNQMVNGKRTTYQQRLKQNVESANTRVKMEESVKNTGVNNGVQLGQARVRAARAEFQQQMEQYQIRQALAQETRMDAMEAFENAQVALEQTQKGTKAYEDAALALGVAYRDLQAAEVKATELIGDSYEKMLEKQTALVEKEAEVMSERINNVKEFQESFKETISKFALANIEAYEAKAFELAELRAKKELGLVQDTARQRYLIIKKNGEYETRWLNQEEYLRTQQEIDANNKRTEALAEGLKNFAERVNKQMRDVFLRRFQLDEEEKKERERQAMLQRVQNDSLVIQHKREHEFTLMMQSEWELRRQAAEQYFDYVNGTGLYKNSGFTIRTEIGSNGRPLQKFATGGFVEGPTKGDRNLIRANGGEVVLTPAQQKTFMAIANGSISTSSDEAMELLKHMSLTQDELNKLVNMFNAGVFGLKPKRNSKIDIAGILGSTLMDEVTVYPSKLILDTYYPFISKYPFTGHSDAHIQSTDEKGNEAVGVTKVMADDDYNLVTNNCSDSTRRLLELLTGKHVDPNLFTTPGDVRSFLKENFGDYTETYKNGRSRIVLPISRYEYEKIAAFADSLEFPDQLLNDSNVVEMSKLYDEVNDSVESYVQAGREAVRKKMEDLQACIEQAEYNVRLASEDVDAAKWRAVHYPSKENDEYLAARANVLKEDQGKLASLQEELAKLPKFATGGIVQGSETGDKVKIRVNGGEMVITKEQQKRLLDLANAKKIDVSDDDFGRLMQKLELTVDGLKLVADGLLSLADIESGDKMSTQMRQLDVAGKRPTPEPLKAGSVVAPQENIGVVPETEWSKMFQRALMEVDLGGTIFEAISNAEDGLFDKEAWKSVGISLGMQMATATSAVLVNKLTEWMTNKMYGKNVEAKWGSQATGEQRKAAIRSAKSNMDVQVQQATDKRRQAVADLKLNRDVYGEQSGEYKAAKQNLQQAQVNESIAKEYERQYLKIMKQYADAANEAQKAMKAASKKDYADKRKAYEEAAGKTITADDMKRAMDAAVSTVQKQYESKGTSFDFAGYWAKREEQNKQQTRIQHANETIFSEGGWQNSLGLSEEDVKKLKEENAATPDERAALAALRGADAADDIRNDVHDMLENGIKIRKEGESDSPEGSGSGPGRGTGDESASPTQELNDVGDAQIESNTFQADADDTKIGLDSFQADAGDTDLTEEEKVKAQYYTELWKQAYAEVGDAADDLVAQKMANDTAMTNNAKAAAATMIKDQKKHNEQSVLVEKAKGVAIGALQEAGAQGSIAVGNMVAEASGSQALGQLTSGLAQAGANMLVHIVESTGKAAAEEGWWMAAIVQPILSATLGALLGAATSKVKQAQSTIAQATGAKAGRLTTGMLTYATGRYNDEELKKGRITSGMMTMADGYQPGQSYNVDGADGKSYNAKYAGSVSDMGTGLVRGTHFGIFSEVKPETVIDGDTTAIIHNKYPFLENAWLQIARTGSLNMQEMLGLDYASIGRTIDTLSKSGAFSGIPRLGGMRMPTFAEGRYPGEDGMLGISGYSGETGEAGYSGMQADIDSRNRLAAAIEAMVTHGVHADVNSGQASRALAKQMRKEQRTNQRRGLYRP